MLKACLNGSRSRDEHSAVPVTPEEVGAEAAAARAAGAWMVHVHPRDETGRESLEAGHVVATVAAIRAAAPGLRVSVSTRDGIVDGAATKARLVAEWPGPDDGGPDCASVNWHEDGAVLVAEALRHNGIGVEAGIWTAAAARDVAASGWLAHVELVLVELLPGASPGADGPSAAAAVLDALEGVPGPFVVHGEDAWAWPVLRWAAERGHDLRVRLEDTLLTPDGRTAVDNAELVTAALRP